MYAPVSLMLQKTSTQATFFCIERTRCFRVISLETFLSLKKTVRPPPVFPDNRSMTPHRNIWDQMDKEQLLSHSTVAQRKSLHIFKTYRSYIHLGRLWSSGNIFSSEVINSSRQIGLSNCKTSVLCGSVTLIWKLLMLS